MADPTVTEPDKYAVVFENERVRVLGYRDEPRAKTSPHDRGPDDHPHRRSRFQLTGPRRWSPHVRGT
jgi:hypothetical protein